jgi:hypothetical protein
MTADEQAKQDAADIVRRLEREDREFKKLAERYEAFAQATAMELLELVKRDAGGTT